MGWVIDVRTFNKLPGIPRSDEANDNKLLKEFEVSKHECIFISHDYWTRSSGQCSPDVRECHKFQVIRRGIETLKKGEAWAFGGDHVEKFDEAKEPVIWMDWFSIDQV